MSTDNRLFCVLPFYWADVQSVAKGKAASTQGCRRNSLSEEAGRELIGLIVFVDVEHPAHRPIDPAAGPRLQCYVCALILRKCDSYSNVVAFSAALPLLSLKVQPVATRLTRVRFRQPPSQGAVLLQSRLGLLDPEYNGDGCFECLRFTVVYFSETPCTTIQDLPLQTP
ncbi:Protein of unknown function [Gryllus bimaculatus]|nr:Protein of unknown function [Gryllus bimaculatus]